MPNGTAEAAYDEAYDEGYDESYDEGYDGESVDEAWFPFPQVRTARPRPLPPRPLDRPVTQAQLQMAVNRLNGDISRNSAAIQKVNHHVRAVGRDVKRQAKHVRDVRKDVVQLRDALIILPLLTKSLDSENSTLGILFPMMMLQGIGESHQGGGSGGGMFGGGDSSMLMMLLLTGALGKK
jgi:hypothetical protein